MYSCACKEKLNNPVTESAKNTRLLCYMIPRRTAILGYHRSKQKVEIANVRNANNQMAYNAHILHTLTIAIAYAR